MMDYFAPASTVKEDTITPQFDLIMEEIKDRKDLMSSPKENYTYLTGYPVFPEGGEWEPSEKKITHFNILPEVREMLIENGFDITIYRDKNPDEVSWEHFQEGRKGIITYKDTKILTLKEKVEYVLGANTTYLANLDWSHYKEAIKRIDKSKNEGELKCYWYKIVVSHKVAEALSILGYDVTLCYGDEDSCYTLIDWSKSKAERIGVIEEKGDKGKYWYCDPEFKRWCKGSLS